MHSAGKGIYGLLALVVEGRWVLRAPAAYHYVQNDIAAGTPVIAEDDFDAELAKRVRSQMPIALAAGPCEHKGRHEVLYSCDVTIREWAATGRGWPGTS
jgi:hypothetical protein